MDRILLLLRAQARDLAKDSYQEIISSIMKKILELDKLSLDNLDKSFQDYLNKVKGFWQEAKKSDKYRQKTEKEKWQREAEKEFNEFLDENSEFKYPREILIYYKALEIPVGSNKDEIKKAWKKLMRKYHPDLFNEDPEKRKVAAELSARITQAFQELLLYMGEK